MAALTGRSGTMSRLPLAPMLTLRWLEMSSTELYLLFATPTNSRYVAFTPPRKANDGPGSPSSLGRRCILSVLKYSAGLIRNSREPTTGAAGALFAYWILLALLRRNQFES